MGFTEWWDDKIGQEGLWGGFMDIVNPSKAAAEIQAGAGRDALAESRRRYEEGTGAVNRGYDEAGRLIAPYAERGAEDWRNFGNMVRSGEFDYQAPAYNDPSFNFEADPGYQFRLSEGNRNIQGSAAASGNMLSGATLKALQRYGQGQAAQEYGAAYNRFADTRQYMRGKYESDRGFGADENINRYNRYAGLANVGYGAAQGLGNMATVRGTNLGNMAIGQGTEAGNIMGQIGNVQAAGKMGTSRDWKEMFDLFLKIAGNASQVAGGGFGGTGTGGMGGAQAINAGMAPAPGGYA